MLPRIAQIHVVADGHHDAALVVIDAAPVRLETILFSDAVGVNELLAGDLIAIVEVEDGVKNGAAVFNVDNGPVGKNTAHPGEEDIPLVAAVKIVAHKKTAAQQKIAQLGGLRVGQVPVAHFYPVQ